MVELTGYPFDGQTFWCPHYKSIGKIMARGIVWEPAVMEFLNSILADDMLFLDIGARYGYHTIFAAKRVRKVIAFEPLKKSREICAENIKRNGHANVELQSVALSSESATGGMYLSHFVTEPEPDWKAYQFGETPAVTLDSLSLCPDVIQLDTLGGEYEVLAGAKETFKAHKPLLILEVNSGEMRRYFGHKLKDLWRLLGDELGYEWTLLEQGSPGTWMPRYVARART